MMEVPGAIERSRAPSRTRFMERTPDWDETKRSIAITLGPISV